MLDLPVAFEDRLGQRLRASVAPPVPLEVPDPQHEVRHGCGAGVQLDPAHLPRRDAEALADGLPDETLGRATCLVFERLQPRQRHVEEVARAARRVQHPDGREPRQEARQDGPRLVAPPRAHGRVRRVDGLLDQPRRRRSRPVPFLAQRLQNRRPDEALDVRPRREVRPEAVALRRIQRPLQKRPEDGRLDILPVGLRRVEKVLALLGRQPGRARVLEQRPVEAPQPRPHLADVAARVHLGKEVGQGQRERVEIVRVGRQETRERAVGDEFGVLGEHGEQRPREESCNGLGVHRGSIGVDGPVERLREACERAGETHRHPRLSPRRVECERVGEDQHEHLADGRVPQRLQRKAVPGRVRERAVEPSRA